MKSLYAFLQTKTILLLFLFLPSNYLPLYFGRMFGWEAAAWMIGASLATSVAIFALCFWWLKAAWVLPRPWMMKSLTVGSMMGIMNFGVALFAVLGNETAGRWLTYVIQMPSAIFQAVALGAFMIGVFKATQPDAPQVS